MMDFSVATLTERLNRARSDLEVAFASTNTMSLHEGKSREVDRVAELLSIARAGIRIIREKTPGVFEVDGEVLVAPRSKKWRKKRKNKWYRYRNAEHLSEFIENTDDKRLKEMGLPGDWVVFRDGKCYTAINELQKYSRHDLSCLREVELVVRSFHDGLFSEPALPTPENGGSETGDCPHPGRKGHEVYARPDGSSHCRACGAEWPPSPTSEGDEQ